MNRFLAKYTPNEIGLLSLTNEKREQLKTIIQRRKNTLFVGDVGSGKTTIIKCILKQIFGSMSQSEYVYWINTLDSAGIANFRKNLQTFCQTYAMGVLSDVIMYPKVVVVDNIDTLPDELQFIIHAAMTRYLKNCWFLITSSSEQSIIERINYDCISIQLENIHEDYLRDLCHKVIHDEKIEMTESVVDDLISCSNHSVRLMLMYLHKFLLLKEPITKAVLTEVCSMANDYEFRKFTISWAIDKDSKESYAIVSELCKRGLALCDLFEKYLDYIKHCDILKEELKYNVIELLGRYITLIVCHHEDIVELAHFTMDLLKLV